MSLEDVAKLIAMMPNATSNFVEATESNGHNSHVPKIQRFPIFKKVL